MKKNNGSKAIEAEAQFLIISPTPPPVFTFSFDSGPYRVGVAVVVYVLQVMGLFQQQLLGPFGTALPFPA
jgi:hypothetical protein